MPAANGRARVVDVDSHVFEPTDVWEQYLDRDHRLVARSAFWHEVDPLGLEVTLLNGRPARSLRRSGVNRQACWRPGMTPEDVGALDPDVAHPITPGAHDPQARLADMDAMGVETALLFPTLFAEHFPLVENADAAAALARAYNDWLWDFSRADPRRLVPVAVLPLQHPSFAVRELDRVAARGFRAAFVRPSFFQGRFPNHPAYDPLWERLQTLDVAACVHPSPGSTNPEWSCEGAFLERVAKNLRIGHDVAEAAAPFMDASIFLTAIAFYGHMERYPKLKLALVHAGAAWVPLALEKAETYLWLFSGIRDVSLEPERVFFHRPSLVGFDSWEAPVARMPDVYEDVAAWGSRYPQHDTGTVEEARATLARWAVPEATVEKYLGGNAARLFGV
ncbi:MAG TPA: amidohydrolase family protein [Candidatus Binatia bacterium]|nr:amidohydrolase family protein [Candidatus Binatia bacterium]